MRGIPGSADISKETPKLRNPPPGLIGLNDSTYSPFILVISILLQRTINPRDFMKYISGKVSLRRKDLIAQKLLLRDKIKKVLSRAHVCSQEQRARNAHNQNEQTLLLSKFVVILLVVLDLTLFDIGGGGGHDGPSKVLILTTVPKRLGGRS